MGNIKPSMSFMLKWANIVLDSSKQSKNKSRKYLMSSRLRVLMNYTYGEDEVVRRWLIGEMPLKGLRCSRACRMFIANLTWGLTIGTWCCLCDHALLTPINSHVNKQHQYLTQRLLSELGELLYWSLYSHFNSSVSYKRSRMHTTLTLSECGWWEKGGLDLFCLVIIDHWHSHQMEMTPKIVKKFLFLTHFCNIKRKQY